jgi:ATP-dependent DNA helicase DinG
MSPGPWLHCRIALAETLDVYVSVSDGRAVFSREDPPDGPCLTLCADADGRPDAESGRLPLPAVALALDAARSDAWLSALGEILEIENRVDAEAALGEIAVHLDLRIRAWRRSETGVRRTCEVRLARMDPAFAELLESWPDSIATVDSGRFERLAPDQVREAPEPDEEHWAGWCARSFEEILGEGGGLSRLLGDQFEPRQGQLDMADAVDKTVSRGEHLMCEAGTGIGKSLGYLVPVLLHGARQQERVVISTHTHTLQSQLVDQDLPLMQRLGYPGRARRLLGRNNYLCRRQLLRALSTTAPDVYEARAQFAIAAWAMSSANGMREELADHPWFRRFWSRHFDSVEPCSPHICHRDPVCFVVKARRNARDAHVVVVNHALLMMDLRGDQSILGPASILVVDEAHQLPEVATHALSVRIARSSTRVHENLAGDRDRPGGPRAVFARMASQDQGIADAARAADGALEGFLSAFAQWMDRLESHFRERLGAHDSRAGQHRVHDAGEAFAPVRDQDARLRERGRAFATELATVLGRTGEVPSELENEREALANLLEYHDELTTQIHFVQEVGDDDHVYWVDWAGEAGLRALVAAPLAVAEPLAKAWDEHYSSVVMTSATLAVESDFMPFAEAVGFDQVGRFTETLQVDSPFKAREQSRLLTSLDLPSPDDPHFPDLVTHVIAAIARDLTTKMLVLSTSYRLIDQIEPRLVEAMAETESDLFERRGAVAPEILVQRPSSSRDALTARFRTARAAVLLATGSFWEGMDFPGDQLEVLVVPRLPFPVPTDPVIEGRTERARRLGRDPFESVSLVDAVLRLKQGVGRLLRTADDRGVVLLFDHRLQTRAYGVRFLNSLPQLVQILPEHADMVSETIEFLNPPTR